MCVSRCRDRIRIIFNVTPSRFIAVSFSTIIQRAWGKLYTSTSSENRVSLKTIQSYTTIAVHEQLSFPSFVVYTFIEHVYTLDAGFFFRNTDLRSNANVSCRRGEFSTPLSEKRARRLSRINVIKVTFAASMAKSELNEHVPVSLPDIAAREGNRVNR